MKKVLIYVLFILSVLKKNGRFKEKKTGQEKKRPEKEWVRPEFIQPKINKELPECRSGAGFDQDGPAYFHLGHSSTMENLRKEQEIKFETTKIIMVPVFYKNQNPENIGRMPKLFRKTS